MSREDYPEYIAVRPKQEDEVYSKDLKPWLNETSVDFVNKMEQLVKYANIIPSEKQWKWLADCIEKYNNHFHQYEYPTKTTIRFKGGCALDTEKKELR